MLLSRPSSCVMLTGYRGTSDVEDADLPKELARPEHSELGDPVVGHHGQLALFDDVHLMAHVALLTHILTGAVHLQTRRRRGPGRIQWGGIGR